MDPTYSRPNARGARRTERATHATRLGHRWAGFGRVLDPEAKEASHGAAFPVWRSNSGCSQSTLPRILSAAATPPSRQNVAAHRSSSTVDASSETEHPK